MMEMHGYAEMSRDIEPSAHSALDLDLGWFAVHTQVRAEFQVAEALRQAGFEAFLPTLTRYITHARTVRERKCALFPRYVFVGFNPRRQSWGPIGSVKGVSRMLQVDGKPLQVPDRLISKIMVDRLPCLATMFDSLLINIVTVST